MDHPNGGQQYGQVLEKLSYIEHDMTDFDRRMRLVEADTAQTKGIFHSMSREKELTIKNLEMSISDRWLTRVLAVGQLTIWLITAIWIIAHTPRLP